MVNAMQKMVLQFWVVVLMMLTSCSGEEVGSAPKPFYPAGYALSSDKARYNPGDAVALKISPAPAEGLRVRYKHLGSVIEEDVISGPSWAWNPPSTDFKGYMVEVFKPATEKESEQVLGTIGVDVSSDWTRFPRYGFLSRFPELSQTEIDEVVDNLNRHHINGVQFYDWHYKHHQPLAGTPDNPTLIYRDIINREIHFNTVKAYIDACHDRGIKAMFYNLVYGALKDAPASGVDDRWYVYTDQSHASKDKHPLSAPFVSDIFLTNPANTSWQEYLLNEHQKVYDALPFDGFHMDQLGDRGNRYDYDGNAINLAQTFEPFISAVEEHAPEKYNVMNAVNQYGQESIASSPVDFLYTEVWSPNETYQQLANIILTNNELSNDELATVLAAYVNYDLANNPGFFNTPSVLLLDAVIFAFGGAHLELGEHMLGKEYFPNNNLAMRDDLRRKLVYYYDFLVAYQNLLRDGGSFNKPALISADNKFQFANWPAGFGSVAVVGKEIGNRQVIHLLNFTNATTLSWRDNSGIQAAPTTVESVQVRLNETRSVAKVWCASPDFSQGAAIETQFTVTGNQIGFTVPGLQYWTMIVIEYQ